MGVETAVRVALSDGVLELIHKKIGEGEEFMAEMYGRGLRVTTHGANGQSFVFSGMVFVPLPWSGEMRPSQMAMTEREARWIQDALKRLVTPVYRGASGDGAAEAD